MGNGQYEGLLYILVCYLRDFVFGFVAKKGTCRRGSCYLVICRACFML